MRITVEDTMAIAIDYQEKLIPVMTDKEELLIHSKILLNGLKLLNIPLIITQQYTKGLGMTVKEIQDPASDDFSYYEKTSFSCWEEETIAQAITDYKKKNIIICGIEAHICVLQTVVDLREAGFQVIVITDCITSRKKQDKETALDRFKKEGAVMATYESILFELTRNARNEKFKEISKLIK